MNELRKTFHHELDDIKHELIRLSSEVVERIPRGTAILLDHDLAGAEDMIGHDPAFDQEVQAVEERCYRVMALQQPMAGDLRLLTGAIKILGEIERSADLVVNLCKAARRLYGTEFDPKLRGYIDAMSEQATHLFSYAVEAAAADNPGLAAALDDMDDLLDRIHADFVQAIFESHANGLTPIAVAVQLALVARFYERIGDHAVNMGERIRFMLTGEMPPVPTGHRELDAAVPPEVSSGDSGSG